MCNNIRVGSVGRVGPLGKMGFSMVIFGMITNLNMFGYCVEAQAQSYRNSNNYYRDLHSRTITSSQSYSMGFISSCFIDFIFRDGKLYYDHPICLINTCAYEVEKLYDFQQIMDSNMRRNMGGDGVGDEGSCFKYAQEMFYYEDFISGYDRDHRPWVVFIVNMVYGFVIGNMIYLVVGCADALAWQDITRMFCYGGFDGSGIIDYNNMENEYVEMITKKSRSRSRSRSGSGSGSEDESNC